MKTAAIRTSLAAAAMLAVAVGANAAVISLPTDLGPQDFDTNNFATSLAASSCSSTCLIFASGGFVSFGPFTTAQIEPYVIGSDLSRGVALGQGPAGAVPVPDFIIPAFGSLASIANGAGADFVIWEAGTPSEPVLVSVSLGGGSFSTAIAYNTAVASPANSASGFVTNSVHINLDDFGIAAGGLIDQVRIQGSFTGVGGSGPDILAIAALNAGPPTQGAPEPGTLALLGLGLAGLAASRRRKQ